MTAQESGTTPTMPPAPPPAPPSGVVSPNRQLMVALAYLWILAIVPLVSEKEDQEVQWHAKQGLVLFGAEIVLWIALAIVARLLAAMTLGFAGCLFLVLYPLVGLAILALHVFCIIKGVNGQRVTIPGIADLAGKF